MVEGLPADARVMMAVQTLCDAFAVCGLRQPVAITVEVGQIERLEALLRRSPLMLVEDARAIGLRVWGIDIVERKP